jgi:hypothetical protein
MESTEWRGGQREKAENTGSRNRNGSQEGCRFLLRRFERRYFFLAFFFVTFFFFVAFFVVFFLVAIANLQRGV